MKTFKTYLFLNVCIALLCYACGSDDNQDSTNGEEIRPIGELAQDLDYKTYLKGYYFSEVKIPNLDVAWNLSKEYEEKGIYGNMTDQQLEELAIAFGYTNAKELTNYIEVLDNLRQNLEARYALSTVDSIELKEIENQVFDTLFFEYMESFQTKARNKGVQKTCDDEAFEAYEDCWQQQLGQYRRGEANTGSCFATNALTLKQLRDEYECATQYTNDIECITIYNRRFEQASENLRCCIANLEIGGICDLNESHPCLGPHFCGNNCNCF